MDVKPDNVYEAAEAVYKLGDFGLATSMRSKVSLDIEEGDNRWASPPRRAQFLEQDHLGAISCAWLGFFTHDTLCNSCKLTSEQRSTQWFWLYRILTVRGKPPKEFIKSEMRGDTLGPLAYQSIPSLRILLHKCCPFTTRPVDIEELRYHGGVYHHTSVCLASTGLPFYACYLCLRLPSTLSMVMNACRYLSPEVLNSDYSQLEKADVFALGATMYQLATGADLPTGEPSVPLCHQDSYVASQPYVIWYTGFYDISGVTVH